MYKIILRTDYKCETIVEPKIFIIVLNKYKLKSKERRFIMKKILLGLVALSALAVVEVNLKSCQGCHGARS